jgi:hypothetical protein
LEPLHVIYAKKDILAAIRQHRPGSSSSATLAEVPGPQDQSAAVRQQQEARHGAHVDAWGMAHAEGKRKTSRAWVSHEGHPCCHFFCCITFQSRVAAYSCGIFIQQKKKC